MTRLMAAVNRSLFLALVVGGLAWAALPAGAVPTPTPLPCPTGGAGTIIPDISANPVTVSSCGSTTVGWSSSLTSGTCDAFSNPENPLWSSKGQIVSNIGLGGGITISNLTQTTTFTVEC